MDSEDRPAGPAAFEQSLARLEAIVKELEQGELPLEQALRLFEEGTELNQELKRRLDDAERRIEILTRARDGGVRTEAFEPGRGE